MWATCGWDGRLQLWDISGKNAGTITLPDKEKGRIISDIAFSPDGKAIAALARRWVYIWSTEAFTDPQAKPTTLLTMEDVGYCNALAYSHDGQQLAVACNDATVRIFDTVAHTLIKTLTVHKNAVMDVAFSQDGTRLATASKDKTFQVSPLRFIDLYEQAKRMQKATGNRTP
jgi:WD40 repeat protein